MNRLLWLYVLRALVQALPEEHLVGRWCHHCRETIPMREDAMSCPRCRLCLGCEDCPPRFGADGLT